MIKILLCTFGSLGDINPYIAIAQELRKRGVEPTIATSGYHRALIEGHGIGFKHVRPDLELQYDSVDELVKKIMDEKSGSEFVLREVIMKNLRDMYDDYFAASDGTDLVVTHPITYGAILAARMRRLPWMATVLAPTSTWSVYDPPSMPKAKWLPQARQLLGVGVSRLLTKSIKQTVYPWAQPYRDLQRDLGLAVDNANPFFEGQYSPLKNLALFSPLFAAPQPDWPPNTEAVGFPFMDDDEYVNPALDDFLLAGAPPLVFTLGSSAVMDPGKFWAESIGAAQRLGTRAVLLVGDKFSEDQRKSLPPSIAAFHYIPHARIFPKASVIVHQGGVGTTAQALRAGKPQLVMPYSHDQFDNAYRVKRLRCGTSVERKSYTASNAAKILSELGKEPYLSSAKDMGVKIASERGAATAADEMIKLSASARA
jgi:UDP:flavonoid glycosyltransferase YjiC (YdhE family)